MKLKELIKNYNDIEDVKNSNIKIRTAYKKKDKFIQLKVQRNISFLVSVDKNQDIILVEIIMNGKNQEDYLNALKAMYYIILTYTNISENELTEVLNKLNVLNTNKEIDNNKEIKCERYKYRAYSTDVLHLIVCQNIEVKRKIGSVNILK